MGKQMKIGLLDSGIGGFSLLRELMLLTPSELGVQWDYVADDGYAPYGLLTPEKVKERALVIGRQLIERGVDLVVVACNTATAYGIEHLRKEFPDMIFVGVEPYLNVLNREPDLLDKGEGTAVLTTEIMGKSPRFKELIERLDPNRRMAYYTCSHLATLIEEAYTASLCGDTLSSDWIVRLDRECGFLRNNGHRQVILGCTHYPLIKDYFEYRLKILPISPCQHVARRVYNRLQVEVSDRREEINDKLEKMTFHFRQTSKSEEVPGGPKMPSIKKAQDLNLKLPENIYDVLR